MTGLPACLPACAAACRSLPQYERLQSVARNVLNETAKRAMAVLEPIKVTITNLDKPVDFTAPDFPFAPERGSHTVRRHPPAPPIHHPATHPPRLACLPACLPVRAEGRSACPSVVCVYGCHD